MRTIIDVLLGRRGLARASARSLILEIGACYRVRSLDGVYVFSNGRLVGVEHPARWFIVRSNGSILATDGERIGTTADLELVTLVEHR